VIEAYLEDLSLQRVRKKLTQITDSCDQTAARTANVSLRHHAEGSPLPRRGQWARPRTIIGELDTQTRN
jgi:hypothetical protein